MSTSIVDINNLSLSYQDRQAETLAVDGLSFSVSEGEFVSIIGPSGCGKTTVLSLLMGLIQPTDGSILVMGEPAGTNNSHVGYMLQRDHLLDWRTVEENVLLSLQVKRMLTPERREHTLRLIHTYGLDQFRSHYPRQLSGGMRQKVALIRTLAFDPTLLLLDEPFSALDYQTRLRAADEILGIIRKEHKTAILVTHDIAEAISMSDRILVFSDRPAHLKAEHVVALTSPDTPLQRRNAPEFSGLFNTLWKELEHHGV